VNNSEIWTIREYITHENVLLDFQVRSHQRGHFPNLGSFYFKFSTSKIDPDDEDKHFKPIGKRNFYTSLIDRPSQEFRSLVDDPRYCIESNDKNDETLKDLIHFLYDRFEVYLQDKMSYPKEDWTEYNMAFGYDESDVKILPFWDNLLYSLFLGWGFIYKEEDRFEGLQEFHCRYLIWRVEGASEYIGERNDDPL